MKRYFTILLIVVLFAACRKENKFPNEPIIKSISFDIRQDTAFWKFSFTDGDGDLGSNDSLGYNYFQKLIFLESDTERIIDLAAERIPKINNTGKTKSIEGEITKKIDLDLLALESTDTVYFSTYVVDQSGNNSNVIVSPIFKLKPLEYFKRN